MDAKELRNKMFEIRMKIIALSPNEKCDQKHQLYEELERMKRQYAKVLLEERELEERENDKHKRK